MKRILSITALLVALSCSAQDNCKCEFTIKYFSDTLIKTAPVNQLERCYINDTLFTTEWRLLLATNTKVMQTDTFAIDSNGTWYHRFEGTFFEAYSKSKFEGGDSFEIQYYDTFYALNKRVLMTSRYIPIGKREVNGQQLWLYQRKNFMDGVGWESNIYVYFDFLYGEVITRHFDEYMVAREPKFFGTCEGVYDAHNAGGERR